MPPELGDYNTMVDMLKNVSTRSSEKDYISLYVTLNLSSKLFNWDKSSVTRDTYINFFNEIKEKCVWAQELIFEVIEDDSILGTTSQKHKAIKGDYDQFIFLDGDMVFHKDTLRYVLDTSYQVDGMYFITPQIVRLWDDSWDILVHQDYKHIPCVKNGYYREHKPELTINQKIKNLNVSLAPYFKFGAGWFTLYSKQVLDLIGIPKFLGHYGPEDTFLMYGSQLAVRKKFDIKQYIIEGLLVSENKIYRKEFMKEGLVYRDLKDNFREQAWAKFDDGLKELNIKLDGY